MAFEETVFITGFPGFIAGRLIERLAADGARLLLLVQPSFVERARHELVRIAERSGAPLGSFEIVTGDITQDQLGLSAADAELVRSKTTIVFHLAALYDLAVAREPAMRVNVSGTQNVNSFARKLPHLRHYHYVSTCYVAGRREGLILETDLKHDSGFRNYYEESKHLAEIEVAALKAELPVTIHRPAVVCGDSQTGETAKYDGVYYLIHYLLRAPRLLSINNIGNSKVCLNLVPVDFVVNALAALARDERAIGKTIQIADHRPPTTRELFDIIATEIVGHGSRITLPAPIVEFFLLFPGAPVITRLPRSAVPYFFLKQTYATTEAQNLLEPRGLRCPPFSSYVGAIVDFARQHPTL